MFLKKDVLKKFSKIHRKTPVSEFFLITLQVVATSKPECMKFLILKKKTLMTIKRTITYTFYNSGHDFKVVILGNRFRNIYLKKECTNFKKGD